jgi:hypothetical protein
MHYMSFESLIQAVGTSRTASGSVFSSSCPGSTEGLALCKHSPTIARYVQLILDGILREAHHANTVGFLE